MWLAGQCSINHLSSEKLESVLRIRLDIKNCIVYFWENRVLVRVELGEDCTQHILERACAAEDGTLLSASQLCWLLQQTQQCRENWALLSSSALPFSSLLEVKTFFTGNSVGPRAKQHPLAPGNREEPCSMERLDVVLAEVLVLHSDLGMEEGSYSYKKLKH